MGHISTQESVVNQPPTLDSPPKDVNISHFTMENIDISHPDTQNNFEQDLDLHACSLENDPQEEWDTHQVPNNSPLL